jgi:hypothetical protein
MAIHQLAAHSMAKHQLEAHSTQVIEDLRGFPEVHRMNLLESQIVAETGDRLGSLEELAHRDQLGGYLAAPRVELRVSEVMSLAGLQVDPQAAEEELQVDQEELRVSQVELREEPQVNLRVAEEAQMAGRIKLQVFEEELQEGPQVKLLGVQEVP